LSFEGPWAKIPFMVVSSWLGAALALDFWGGRQNDPQGSWDAILVPGCAVRHDGQAAGALNRRTTRAVELFHAGLAPILVLTGGIGRYPPAEAIAAAQVATCMGVPETSIVLENRSKNTAENAAFAAELIDAKRVIVVSDRYHTLRCRSLFKEHFDEVFVVGCKGPMSSRAVGSVREVAAWGLKALGR
jgi:uncharacterized SAM-binding protein YcdF (DUF218 family)